MLNITDYSDSLFVHRVWGQNLGIWDWVECFIAQHLLRLTLYIVPGIPERGRAISRLGVGPGVQLQALGLGHEGSRTAHTAPRALASRDAQSQSHA